VRDQVSHPYKTTSKILPIYLPENTERNHSKGEDLFVLLITSECRCE
jgi:hypothetical protein